MKNQTYRVGARVVFISKHGSSTRNGRVVVVTIHGNGSDASGIAHGIKFGDGYKMWAYPQELTPAPA
jgi:hypothetical protein